MADDVPSLAEYLGPVLPMLELYEIDKMYVVQHKRSDWGANWKGGVDAFYETYHLHAIQDRKSVVQGKSVSVRVDLGGRRTIKKQQLDNEIINNEHSQRSAN